MFFGSRGNLLAIYINVLLCYLVKLRRKSDQPSSESSPWLPESPPVGVYLGSARAGEYSLGSFLASFAVLFLFGNNFSDLRDFAWVYSAWDHVFWVGKTYLAALLAFVPRFASEFRDTWGLEKRRPRPSALTRKCIPGCAPECMARDFLILVYWEWWRSVWCWALFCVASILTLSEFLTSFLGIR